MLLLIQKLDSRKHGKNDSNNNVCLKARVLGTTKSPIVDYHGGVLLLWNGTLEIWIIFTR